MGISPFRVSSSAYDKPCSACGTLVGGRRVSAPVAQATTLPNPDPRKFSILDSQTVGDCVVLLVSYDGCTNFEGKKVLVYQDASLDRLRKQGRTVGLDPHFSDNADLASPVARFRPTKDGWRMAVGFARGLAERTL